MKVVINTCFGGFSLSPRGLRRYAELKGRPCYFFKRDIVNKRGLNAPLEPITIEEAEKEFMFLSFDIPNPQVLESAKEWHEMSMEERQANNAGWNAHALGNGREIERHDPDLIRVVEELGGEHRNGAAGKCAELTIVEIPDDVDYTIEEYDGNEHIAERHRTWP